METTNTEWFDSLPERCRKALTAFAATCVRAVTGISVHPIDTRNWNEFVILRHAAGPMSESDAAELPMALERRGVSPDAACELAVRYERARELLALYDRMRD